MPSYLLKPVVSTWECKMLTPEQFSRLLKRIKTKKFGAKMIALDVEEVVTTEKTKLHGYRESVNLPPGNYFNVHVEYVV